MENGTVGEPIRFGPLTARRDRAFGAAGHGARDRPARHYPVHAVHWSEALLTPSEHRLLTELSVFVGGWTLEDAQAVATEDPSTVPDTVAALVDQSLIKPVDEHDQCPPRCSFPHVARDFALSQPDATDHATDIRRRHAEYIETLIASSRHMPMLLCNGGAPSSTHGIPEPQPTASTGFLAHRS